jgi:hypothetical protein
MKTIAGIVLPAILIVASSNVMATTYSIKNTLPQAFTYKSTSFAGPFAGAAGSIAPNATSSLSTSSGTALKPTTVIGYTTSISQAGIRKVYSYCHYMVPTGGVNTSFSTSALTKTSCTNTP